MEQEQLIEQIVERAALVVQKRLTTQEEPEIEPVKQTEPEEQCYYFQIRRKWRFPRTYRVKHHMFATQDWLQNPATGEFLLAPSMPAVVLTLADDARLIIPSFKAESYRIWK